jgi:2-polyprenyl-3-methyl-5-hydroxy-6-metoxy-1,4-benzoquinol methylase
LYSTDLAFVHDAAFGDFNRRVAPEIVTVLRRARIRSGRIVDAGCGSGILAQRLIAAGYAVTGFDVSPAMIRLAKARAPRATFRVATLASARIPPCDAVVCVGEVITYLAGGIVAVDAFFRRVHAALPPGGVLVVDYLHSAQGRTYPTKTIAGDGWTMAVRADYDRTTRTLTRRIALVRRVGRRMRHSRETHTVHVYDTARLAAALERLGFRVAVRRSIGRYRLLAGDSAIIARRI